MDVFLVDFVQVADGIFNLDFLEPSERKQVYPQRYVCFGEFFLDAKNPFGAVFRGLFFEGRQKYEYLFLFDAFVYKWFNRIA